MPARRTRLAWAAGCALMIPAAALAQATDPSPSDPPEAAAQSIEVVGRRQSGQYHEGHADGATKTGTPLLEVPQAVRVLPRQLLDDLSALRVDDVLDYVAGASRQNNFGGTWDNVAMRGFAGHEDTGMSLLRNGMPANRGFNAPRDTANLERLEFLKGTMAALYGTGEPGGTLNLVTKAPRFTAGHSVEAYFGSHDTQRLAFDSTGPIDFDAADGEPATLAYRLNLSLEDKGSFRDHVHSRRTLLAPALAWRLGPDTTVRYDGEWLRQQAPLDRGIVAVNGRPDAVPASRFYGEPADGDITIDNQTHQLFVDHELGGDWRLHGGLQHKRGTLAGLASEGHPYGPSPCPTAVDTEGWLCRRLRERDFASEETSLQLELNGRLRIGGLQHELLAGAEWSRYRMDQHLLQQAGGERYSYGISVFDPTYGAARPALTVVAMDRTLDDRSTAVYLQDQIDLSPQWKLLAGVRHDRYDGEVDDRNHQRTTQRLGATSPRLGLAWLAQRNWSAYASVGRSFRPQTNTDAAGNTLPPETGTAAEIGSKWQSADGRLGASVALFDIAKKHRTVYDENGVYLVEVPGTVRNRGAEFEMAGWMLPGWRVALAYAYLDTDETITQFARHSGSAFVVRELPLAGAGMQGLLGLGGGVTHVGERAGDTGAPRLPGYTVAKLTAYWSVTPKLRLSLDVDNLFDRRYFTSAYNSVWVTPGSPRSAVAGVQYKF